MFLSKFMTPNMYIRLKELKYGDAIKPYKELLRKNAKYKDIHKGKRCFILANGPSVNKLDFSLLKDEVTFTVNQIVRNPQFERLNANYHMWADRIFFEIEDGNQEDMEMLQVIKNVSKKAPNVEIFYEVTAKSMIDKYHLDECSNVAYFQSIALNAGIMEKTFIDFTHCLPNYPTVIDYAICLAVYMGFNRIYLLGCDCTGFINVAQNKMAEAKNNLYAFEMSENAAKRMERYSRQRNIQNELNTYVALFDEYDRLGIYCKRNGVKLFNATDGGLLECLPRVKLDVVLKK